MLGRSLPIQRTVRNQKIRGEKGGGVLDPPEKKFVSEGHSADEES